MKLLKWVRFTWNLTELSSSNLPLPAHYQIAPVTPEDERELRKVYSSSFLLDPIWNPVIGEVMHSIQSRLDNIFPSANSTSSVNSTCLALRHGARIIGAAVLSLHAVEKELQASRFHVLRVAGLPLKRDLFVVWDRRRVLPIPARLFLDFLQPSPESTPAS